MEIFEQFGFDWRLFAAQVVNFLVIAYIFKRFLYKPLLDVLSKRNQAIKKGLKDAENAAKASEQAENEKEEILKKASIEADRILSEAKEQAQQSREEIMNQAKLDIEKMMTQTKEAIALEKENFKKEAKDLSLTLSQTLMQNVIVGLFDKKESDVLTKKAITKLKYDKSSKN